MQAVLYPMEYKGTLCCSEFHNENQAPKEVSTVASNAQAVYPILVLALVDIFKLIYRAADNITSFN